VAHVMRIFDRRFIKRGLVEEALRRTVKALAPARAAPKDSVADALKLMCDEEALEFVASGTEAAREAISPPPLDFAERPEE
jgi:hypothetical protein